MKKAQTGNTARLPHGTLRWIFLFLTLWMVQLSVSASAEIRVVTTLPVLADLARQVGGNYVSVQALAKGTEDAHEVVARPSLMAAVTDADLFVEIGLQLELWSERVLEGAGNYKVLPGQPGHVYAAEGTQILDVPERLTRADGDVHPSGNPHIWTNPHNAIVMAENIAAGLKRVDPEHAQAYDANLANFTGQIETKIDAWLKRAAPLHGLKFVAYHKGWDYLAEFLGMTQLNTVEEKPGIPPSAGHRDRLVAQMKTEGVQLIVLAPYNPRKIPEQVAQMTNAQLVVLPSDVQGIPAATDYFKLMDNIISQLLTAVGLKG